MIRRIHDKLGTAGLVIAVVALVAALGGTAFAAAGLNGKQKKEVKKIAKQFAGKPGTNGAQGPKGDTGPAGPAGNPGKEGARGPAGETGAAGEDGACSASVPQCVLPSGATLTGDWAFATKGHAAYLQVSFPLRVVPKPSWHWIGKGGPTADCPGSAADPKAAPGNLCFYALEIANVNAEPNLVGASTADETSGWVGEFVPEGEAEGYGYGSWAVTAGE
jgi:Collagen triple helix repeat (20 copies)